MLTKTLWPATAPKSRPPAPQRDARDPFTRLGAAADMYHDALERRRRTPPRSPRGSPNSQATAEQLAPGVTRADAWPVLRKHLALLAAAGDDPATVLTDAVSQAPAGQRPRPRRRARLAHRPHRRALRRHRAAALAARHPRTSSHDDPQWGRYLARRADLVTDLADQIRATARDWTPATAPAWAKPVMAADPTLAAEIAVFRAAHTVAPEDTRLLGADQYAARAPRHPDAPGKPRRQRDRAPHTPTPVAGNSSSTPSTPASAPTATGPNWPPASPTPHAAAPTSPSLGQSRRRPSALPDELPAAALWWRLSAELTAGHPRHPPRPTAPRLDHRPARRLRLRASPKPSPPTPPGPAWSPRSPPPTPTAGPRATCCT